MNSESKYYYNKETFANEKRNGCDNQCGHSMPGELLLKCRNGTLGPMTSIVLAPPLSETFNQTIAKVTINTSCLNCPTILISFDGILNIKNNSGQTLRNATFIFTLFKICKGSTFSEEAISTFNYSVSERNNDNIEESRTLSFQYSTCNDECNDCNDCCTYRLELTRISYLQVPVNMTFSINGKVCALAVG